jgi:hypothetical protein
VRFVDKALQETMLRTVVYGAAGSIALAFVVLVVFAGNVAGTCLHAVRCTGVCAIWHNSCAHTAALVAIAVVGLVLLALCSVLVLLQWEVATIESIALTVVVGLAVGTQCCCCL